MKTLKYIIINIPKVQYAKVVFEDEFIDGNEFRTQNQIIAVLKLMGFKSNEIDVRLIYHDFNKGD